MAIFRWGKGEGWGIDSFSRSTKSGASPTGKGELMVQSTSGTTVTQLNKIKSATCFYTYLFLETGLNRFPAAFRPNLAPRSCGNEPDRGTAPFAGPGPRVDSCAGPGPGEYPEPGCTLHSELLGFGTMEVTKPYELLGFGTMEVTKPYELLGFGTMV